MNLIFSFFNTNTLGTRTLALGGGGGGEVNLKILYCLIGQVLLITPTNYILPESLLSGESKKYIYILP